jgi:hypothetical protein
MDEAGATYFIEFSSDIFYVRFVLDACHSNMPYRCMIALTISTAVRSVPNKYMLNVDVSRGWYNFYVSRGETDTCTVDMFYGKRLWDGVIFEARVKYFDHVIFVEANVQLEFLHVARMDCEAIFNKASLSLMPKELTFVELRSQVRIVSNVISINLLRANAPWWVDHKTRFVFIENSH